MGLEMNTLHRYTKLATPVLLSQSIVAFASKPPLISSSQMRVGNVMDVVIRIVMCLAINLLMKGCFRRIFLLTSVFNHL